MKGWRQVVQICRRSATSGRCCSLASKVFFMVEAEPMEPTADRGAVRRDAMIAHQFQAQLIQGQLTLLCQARTNPIRQPVELAGSA